jgi:hypothetical protein
MATTRESWYLSLDSCVLARDAHVSTAVMPLQMMPGLSKLRKAMIASCLRLNTRTLHLQSELSAVTSTRISLQLASMTAKSPRPGGAPRTSLLATYHHLGHYASRGAINGQTWNQIHPCARAAGRSPLWNSSEGHTDSSQRLARTRLCHQSTASAPVDLA